MIESRIVITLDELELAVLGVEPDGNGDYYPEDITNAIHELISRMEGLEK